MTAAPGGSALGRLRRAVLGVATAGLRPFPWRHTRDPWAVLVSEVMLQQTQAQRVVAPYVGFLARFPTPGACAPAGLGAVLEAWAGLGYNRRARSLHQAAGVIVDRHGGIVPAALEDLRRLPGIGAYTSRAVRVFAFERHEAVVDVNVARVLARAVAGTPLSPGAAQSLADELVPPGRAWEWNQALLEIGAVHCRSRTPACDRCPLRRCCVWSNAATATPDPAPASSRQTRFEGSDRQGRGRLVDALRSGPVPPGALRGACGWPQDPARARRVADGLVADGLARRTRGNVLVLP
ncbi:MAG TPA: A/G-specific adenine glycosylase [Acidimicrobiales bacterium]